MTGECVAADRGGNEEKGAYVRPKCGDNENILASLYLMRHFLRSGIAPPSVCEIESWCPVEVDRLPMEAEQGPLIPGREDPVAGSVRTYTLR